MKTPTVVCILSTLCFAGVVRAQPYAQTSAWQFGNFKDASFPWDLYRDTFIGIPPTEDPWSSAFDVLFYEQVYKSKLSNDGNCFGMSLMSLMMLKNGGHLGFCLPIWQYSGDIANPGNGPTDPMLKRAINMMHGHQVNLPTVQLILDTVAQHKNRDGSFAFTAFQTAHTQNDLTLICITPTLNPSDGGHTLAAYDAQDLGGGNKRIFVYDPNRSWSDVASQAWYTSGSNFVQVNGTAWNFTMSDGTVWSGDPGGGGNILIVPISVTGPLSRSPASLGDQIIGRILNELLLTGDSARVEQITDARGKRLFRPGTYEVDSDPATGMMNMVPWFPSDQSAASKNPGLMLFHLGDSAGALSISISAPESGYTLQVNGTRGQVTVTAAGGRGTDVITLTGAGTIEPTVAVENGRGTTGYTLELTHADSFARSIHTLRSRNAAVPLGARFQLAATDRHQALAVSTSGAATQYDLELQSVTPNGTQGIMRRAIVQDPGLVQTVRPANWSRLAPNDIVESSVPAGTSRFRARQFAAPASTRQ
jgi:hypothetical protein